MFISASQLRFLAGAAQTGRAQQLLRNDTMVNGNGADWASLEPKHGTDFVYCKGVQDNVPPGTFLVLSDGKVVRMITSLRGQKMKANVFESATDVPFDVPDLPVQNNI